MKRSLLAALLLPLIAQAQTTEFGNLNVVQNDSGNATTSVTITKGAGSSPNFAIRSGSTKADYNITFGTVNDYQAGVVVASVTENGRNNDAFGETIGTFYATVGVELDSTTAPSRYYFEVDPVIGPAELVLSDRGHAWSGSIFVLWERPRKGFAPHFELL